MRALVPSPSCRLSLPDSDSASTLASGEDDAGLTDVEEGKGAEACSNGKPALDSQPMHGRDDGADGARSAMQGRLCLLGVAVLWGTYPVALRQASVPHP